MPTHNVDAILDIELIYNIWQNNGSIYGPYGADMVYRFYMEQKLEFPTRIQISEVRKKGARALLDYFGTARDLQEIFGIPDFLPKRLSQFKGKWPLPEIHPNIALLNSISAHSNLLAFDIVAFLSNLNTSNYCPFITGFQGEVAEEHALSLSSVVEIAKRILMEYGNLEMEEKQHFHVLLSEVFSPRMCDVCNKAMENQHFYLIHALSLVHLENAVVKCQKTFTIELDYLKLRKMLDYVKKYTYEREFSNIVAKSSAKTVLPTQFPAQLPLF